MTNEYGNLELHTVLLSAMKDIDKICRENGLRYYLYAGTLLGALNHKGFIPWDDDVDISMFPEDYIKFSQIIQTHYTDKYFIETYENTGNHFSMMPKFRILGTELEYDNGTIEPVFIDLSIFHSVPNCNFLRFFQKNQLLLWDKVNAVKAGRIVPTSFIAKASIGLLSHLSKITIENKLQRIMEHYDNQKDTKYVALMIHLLPNPYTGMDGYTNDMIPRAWCKNPKRIPFEDSEFMAYENPELDVVRRYGEDYWKPYPEEKRVTKHGVIRCRTKNVGD